MRVFWLAAMLGLVGCGNSSDDGESSSSSLDGTWVGPCEHEETKNGNVTSKSTSVHTLTFKGDQFTLQSDSYDPDVKTCDTLSESTIVTGTFAIGADVNEDAGLKDVKALDVTLTKGVTTLKTEAAAKENNESKLCDATDWAVGVEKEVTKCYGADRKLFAIFRIDSGKYYEGADDATKDGTTAEKRPTKIETAKVFTKK